LLRAAVPFAEPPKRHRNASRNRRVRAVHDL
jgi:hypothetical protein